MHITKHPLIHAFNITIKGILFLVMTMQLSRWILNAYQKLQLPLLKKNQKLK